jgi:hypothetical protein
MKGPNDLGQLSAKEKQLAHELEEEIIQHFQNAVGDYEFSPFSIGAGEYSERVKREVIARSRKAGWIVSDLQPDGGFTVKKP